MTEWYAPNQQAVRADGSGPAEEGTGGASAPAKSAPKKTPAKTAGKAASVDEED